MSFDPGLRIGQDIKNEELVRIFKCGNMGGMRRARATNTLVLVSDYTKGLYHDKWIAGTLHYTGMGKNGDQDIEWAQNKTLANSDWNGVDVHLFEVMDEGIYTYCGHIELVGKPYTEIQPGEDGIDRTVWMFPIRPVPENDVKKPPMYTFKDMDDYRTRGRNVDAEYARWLKSRRSRPKTPIKPVVISPVPSKPKFVVPEDIVGKQIKHKKYGVGIINSVDGMNITVLFSSVGEKELNYKVCTENHIVELT